MGDWYLTPSGRWAYDPNAPDPGPNPPATQAVPVVRPQPYPRDVETLHGDEEEGEFFSGDVGDWIDPNAPDPTGPEVNDPNHPDYVEPWRPGGAR